MPKPTVFDRRAMPSAPGDHAAELSRHGYCVLKAALAPSAVEGCRAAFWPKLLEYLSRNAEKPNRGPHRHFLPMPFEPPCFAPELFFNPKVLRIVTTTLGAKVIADQWGCDVPLRGSAYQEVHVDYERPLFEEAPDFALPPYMLVVSFGLTPIAPTDGPIEIAPGTHRLTRGEAQQAIQTGKVELQPVLLEAGDVLIRHPWALHRGTPNHSYAPRALVSIRYVRRWYADASREVSPIPRKVWNLLPPEQQAMMRFPIQN